MERFKDFSVPTLYETLGLNYLMDPSIRPLDNNMKLCGRAFTVETIASDSLPILKALDMVKPGEVLVIAAGNSIYSTIWGGLSTKYAIKKGIAGIVTDGSVRDYHEIIESKLPVFSKGVYSSGPKKVYQGKFKEDVYVGGVTISNGDIIVADANGIVIIPKEMELEIYNKAVSQKQKEDRFENKIDDCNCIFDLINNK